MMEPRYAMRPEPSLWQRISERVWQLIVKREVDLLEVAWGFLMLGWGLQLLMPWDTFRTGVGYQVIAKVMPEDAWGLVLAWVGFTKIGAYVLDQRRVRMGVTLIAVMIWSFFSIAFGLSNPYGTGIVVYPILAFTSALIFWRLITHRVSD